MPKKMTDLASNDAMAWKAIQILIIVMTAVGVPVYFLMESDWQRMELGLAAIIPLFLYIAAVSGFVLLAVGVRGRNVTTTQTDEMLIQKYTSIRRAIRPFVLLLVFSVLGWTVYKLWALVVNA